MFFFFNDTATTEIYTLSLHDALPISQLHRRRRRGDARLRRGAVLRRGVAHRELPPGPRAEMTIFWGLVAAAGARSEEHTSELQSPCNLVCRLLLEKKKHINETRHDVL